MHNYFLRLSVLLCTFFSFSFAQDVLLSIDGSSLNYVSSADIYGFQFDHDGCATGTSGGDNHIEWGIYILAPFWLFTILLNIMSIIAEVRRPNEA